MAAHALFDAIGGRYQPLDKLGAGGMGVVFRALDRLTAQPVALKSVIVPENVQEGDIDVRLALAQEFQTLASLRHPNIISVLDYGFDAGRQPYFTMDLLEAPQTILMAGRRLPLAGKIGLLVQTLQALAYLHRRGILHRDLKPGNVLVHHGQIKVLDFGLSQEVGPEQGIVGTPAYMAPELLQGERPSTASDLYAVGIIAYELLAGRHPFDTANVSRLIAQALNAQPDLTLLAINLEQIPQPEQPPATLPEPVSAEDDDLLQDTARVKPSVEYPTDLNEKTTRASIAPDQPTRPHIPAGEQTTVPNIDVHAAQMPPAGSPAPERQADSPLVAVVRRLLAKNPHDRYGDASAVIRDLAAATGEPLPVETEATRESFLQAARFVGRAAECAQLTAALDEVIAGRGSAWLIGGESGVGKSRLLNEMRTRALVKGALVLSGQAVSETGAPYQVWREPLRRLILVTDLSDTDAGILKVLVPDIANLIGRAVPDAPDLDPEQARKRLLAVLASIFHRQTQPVVLILEDLHWAGSESLAALGQIGQSAAKLLILGSYRNDESPDLPEKLPQMRTLQLKRLGGTDIAALSESMLGEAGRQPRVLNLLQRETEGNVFFLVEVVRALAEEAGQLDRIGTMTLPANVFTGGVQRIVQRRLGRVPEAARPLLQVAAILGRQLDLAVLQAAAPAENLERWLAVCNDAAVLEVHDEYWRFTHDKLREGVLTALDDSARPALHRQAALAVEATHPDQVAALAFHWGMAGDTVKEMQYVTPAAEQANRVSAYQEAITYFMRALVLLTEDGLATAQRAALTEKLGRVYARLSNYTEAVRLFQESLTLADEIGERAVRAASLCCLGNVARVQGAPADATRYYTDGLAVSREIGDRHTMAEALRGLARIAAAQGQYAEAAQRSGESLVISREIGDRWGSAQALSDLALVAIAQGAHAEAGRRLEESLTIFREIGDRRAMASVLLNLAQVAQYQGSPGKATRRLEESLAISREIGDRWSIAATLNNLGYIALLEGAYDQAGAYLEESLVLFREIGSRAAIVQTLTNLGHAASGQGKDSVAALRFHDALTASLELNAAPLTLEIVAGVARLRAKAGDLEQALMLIGLTLNHPGCNSDIKALAEPLLAELRAKAPPSLVESALERGKTRDLNVVVAEILAANAPGNRAGV